ncbi:hypothetical protein PFISCL1PPCAC_13510, partial [Pristionchus fissidentatus]
LRLRFIFCFIHADANSLVRLSVMYLQMYGPVERVATTHLVVSSLIREAFLAYFSSLYESGVPSTTLFFAVLEILHLAITYIDSLSLIYDYTADISYVIHCGIFVCAGVAVYYIIYRIDLQELETLKKGATIDSYSVARNYQLKENINLMNMLSSIAIPFIICLLPEFVFYPAFSLIPKDAGYNGIRYFSIALYDVWIAVVAIVGIGLFPICEPKIAKHMPKALK